MADESAEELIAAALRAGRDTERGWEQVLALRRRGDEETLRAVERLFASADAERRALGADILGQLGNARSGVPDRPVRSPALELLLATIETERDPIVLEAMASALGHFVDVRATTSLCGLRGHPAEPVRQAVVMGLDARDDDRAADALIELSRDDTASVRDWATFGLAMTPRDSDAIREALVARLADSDDTTRAESIRGLAVRKDPRAISPLLRELDDGSELDDPAILDDALYALAADWPSTELCEHVNRHAHTWQQEFPGDSLPAHLLAAVQRCREAQLGSD